MKKGKKLLLILAAFSIPAVALLNYSECVTALVGEDEGGVDRGALELVRAAYYGDTEKTRLLIGQGADVNGKDEYGMTALLYASKEGHTEVVKLLLENGADASAEAGEMALYSHGVTALFLATVKGHTEVVNILKEAGKTGEGLWKYMVIAIWILLWSLILSGRAVADN